MTDAVVDASVAVEWIASERSSRRARALLARHRSGELRLYAPPLLFLEVLNTAARRWTWPEAALATLADELGRWRLNVLEPELSDVAAWAARGLTAYDACYVALAERLGCELATFDADVLAVAAGLARAPE